MDAGPTPTNFSLAWLYGDFDPRRVLRNGDSSWPSVKGRRISVRFVADTALIDGGKDLLIREFGLEHARIEDAVRWRKSVYSYLATA